MDRIWLRNYPAGVPADVDVNRYPSLVALLEESFAKFRDRKAFICIDKAMTLRRARRDVGGARCPICRARACKKAHVSLS